MITCAVVLLFLLATPPLANVFFEPCKELAMVSAEVIIALLTTGVLAYKSHKANDRTVRGKLAVLGLGMLSLALAEGLCNVAFLQGTVGVRGQTHGELFYIGFWAALAVFVRWHYGPLWHGKQLWPGLCVLVAFCAAMFLQLHFIAPDLLHAHHAFEAIPHLSIWVVSKAILAVLVAAYSARAVAICDFVFLHGTLAAFSFAVSSSYKFAASGQSQYWVEYGWLTALGAIFFAVAAPGFESKAFAKRPRLSPWLSVRSLLAVSGAITGSLALTGAALHGTLNLQQGLDLSFLLWLLLCAWCISNYIALGMHTHMHRAILSAKGALSLSETASFESCGLVSTAPRRLIAEFGELFRQYEALSRKSVELAKVAMVADKDAEIGRLAAQVAHDIRSPLAALQMCLPQTANGLTDETADLAQMAIQRVQDIANNLLAASRPVAHQQQTSQPKAWVGDIVDNILLEKRSKLKMQSGVALEACVHDDVRRITLPCSRVEIMRSLSNLIDNSADALKGLGTITLRVQRSGADIEVSVEDDGPGIAPEILSQLGERGATFGKADGNGLGLFGARTLVESTGGSFHIESVLGRGTAVRMTFPS